MKQKTIAILLATTGFLAASLSFAQVPLPLNPKAPGVQAELSRNLNNYTTGAYSFWNEGYFGQGVTVGVIDTGINLTTSEFTGKIRNAQNFSGVGAITNAMDRQGHGSHVAGIIAAAINGKGMAGMAPMAYITPIKVLDGPSGSFDSISRGIDYATSKQIKISNISLGWSGADNLTGAALQRAVNSGMLLTIAAGNEKAANPSWPGRYASQSWAYGAGNGMIITVGSVEKNNVLSSYSNKAGDTMNNYLVAPGSNVVSVGLNGETLAQLSGTSMASPVVAGAAALIMSKWSYLTPKDVGNILLSTAKDLGAKGVDPIYGRGLVQINAAQSPVGITSMPTRR